MKLKLGDAAPNFILPDQNGENHSSKEYLGYWALIYFYPKDDTPGCTKEACALRDNFPEFVKLKAVVIGISVDIAKSHTKFANKYNLPFTLLADAKKEVVKKYGVWGLKKFMGREYFGTIRTSFLIDPKGKIVKIYQNVKPLVHASQVLEDLENLRKVIIP